MFTLACQLLLQQALLPLGTERSMNTVQISSGQGDDSQKPTLAWRGRFHSPSARTLMELEDHMLWSQKDPLRLLTPPPPWV